MSNANKEVSLQRYTLIYSLKEAAFYVPYLSLFLRERTKGNIMQSYKVKVMFDTNLYDRSKAQKEL